MSMFIIELEESMISSHYFLLCIVQVMLFFWGQKTYHQITTPAQGEAEVSVRLLLAKNPACSFSCPSCQVSWFSFERFPRSWQTVGPVLGPFHCADSFLRREWNTTCRKSWCWQVSTWILYHQEYLSDVAVPLCAFPYVVYTHISIYTLQCILSFRILKQF